MRKGIAIALCALALSLAAQDARHEDEVRIGVLGLFHPTKLVIHKLAGHALECGISGQRQPIVDPLEVNGIDLQSPKPATLFKDAPFSCNDGAGGETEFAISIPGKISRRYRGKLQLYDRAERIEVVVTMSVETAVASVVTAEAAPDAPLETLKAQAVAARSFLIAGRGSHKAFDFCDTTHCQFLRSPPPIESPGSRAAIETRGLVLTYREAAIAAMYSESCSGKTHSLEELGIPVHGYPYFSVACDYCKRHPQKWSARLSKEEAAILSGTEASRLKLARKLGWSSVPSNSFDTREENGAVILRGVGIGHGMGLCQRGAADMGSRGSSFREILAHYYPNTELRQFR
jgi:hypothetical protein